MKKLLVPALFLALSLMAGSVAQAQNWPAFRGQNGTGVGDGNNLPTSWNVEKSTTSCGRLPFPV